MKRIKIYVTFLIMFISLVTFFGEAKASNYDLINQMSLMNKNSLQRADSNYMVINKDNLEDYFDINGTASYDKNSGIITLTPDKNGQTGNVTLQNKIDTTQSFTLTGQINSGAKTQKNLNGKFGGGDGIGIGLHDGEIDKVGNNGGAVGFGGLKNAFGWKADTYWNDNSEGPEGKYLPDPNKFAGNSILLNKEGNGSSFGSFVYTNDNNFATSYDGGDSPAQGIPEPEGNTFKNFEMKYDGDTHIMNVTYDNVRWSKNISNWEKNNSYAFFISAATGGATNLQQFKLDNFSYYANGTAKIRYVDDAENKDILPVTDLSGKVGSTENINDWIFRGDMAVILLGKGYSQVGMTHNDATVLDNQGNLTYNTKQSEIIVHYVRKTGNVQVRYEDDHGKQIFDESGSLVTGVPSYPTGNFIGETYTTEKKDITNYTFLKMKDGSLAAEGKLDAKGGEVTY
ncbi:lectin-like domain-containing protein, partial [Dellaglioa carnosa]|uniref:lectin-like domain-containing protein n=1 Tax=Dellaglioa carnosa TaxID=2995136 RepID=UPI0022A81EAE